MSISNLIGLGAAKKFAFDGFNTSDSRLSTKLAVSASGAGHQAGVSSITCFTTRSTMRTPLPRSSPEKNQGGKKSQPQKTNANKRSTMDVNQGKVRGRFPEGPSNSQTKTAAGAGAVQSVATCGAHDRGGSGRE